MHGELVESLLEIFQLQMDKNVQPPLTWKLAVL